MVVVKLPEGGRGRVVLDSAAGSGSGSGSGVAVAVANVVVVAMEGERIPPTRLH